jgi:hypothetical protein
MVAAAAAFELLISTTDRRRRIELPTLLKAHAALMRDDPHEHVYAGRLREVPRPSR